MFNVLLLLLNFGQNGIMTWFKYYILIWMAVADKKFESSVIKYSDIIKSMLKILPPFISKISLLPFSPSWFFYWICPTLIDFSRNQAPSFEKTLSFICWENYIITKLYKKWYKNLAQRLLFGLARSAQRLPRCRLSYEAEAHAAALLCLQSACRAAYRNPLGVAALRALRLS